MTTPTVDAVTAGRLAHYIERAERLHEEAASIRDDLKTVFAEAKSEGFDPKELKRIIKYHRADVQTVRTSRAVFDTYMNALSQLAGTPLGDFAAQFVSGVPITVVEPVTAEARAAAAAERVRVAREDREAATERRDAERIAKIPDPKKSAADRAMETSMREAAKRGGSTLGTSAV